MTAPSSASSQLAIVDQGGWVSPQLAVLKPPVTSRRMLFLSSWNFCSCFSCEVGLAFCVVFFIAILLLEVAKPDCTECAMAPALESHRAVQDGEQSVHRAGWF